MVEQLHNLLVGGITVSPWAKSATSAEHVDWLDRADRVCVAEPPLSHGHDHTAIARHKLRCREGSEALVFEYQPEEDNLAAVGFQVGFQQTVGPLRTPRDVLAMLRHRLRRRVSDRPVRVTLTIYAPHRSRPLRQAQRKVMCGSQGELIFRFPTITDCAAQALTMVLNVEPALDIGAVEVTVSCYRAKHALMVCGHRQHHGKLPVVLPYLERPMPRIAPRTAPGAPESTPPRVSILISTFNSRNVIGPCLRSLAELEYDNFEVVVVDNASTDDTRTIVAEAYPAARLFTLERNIEFAAANNRGFAECTGTYVLVLNADTELRPAALRKLVRVAETSPRIGSVSPNIMTKGSLVRYADVFIRNGCMGRNDDALKRCSFVLAGCGAATLVRKSAVEASGGLFDEWFVSNQEDHDLGIRLWLHGHVCVHLPAVLVDHLGAGVYGLANPKRDTMMYRNFLTMCYKNFERMHFVRTLLGAVKQCWTIYRLRGILRFFGGMARNRAVRATTQAERRINDDNLRLWTWGASALVSTEEQGRVATGANQTASARQ